MSERQAYLEAAVEAARSAGRMLRERAGQASEVSFKGEVDLVTESDNLSQKMIVAHLSTLFPDHDFLAEEGLCRESGSSYRWVIDPLDGTTNFAHHFPIFCVSIGLEVEGRAELGAVYDPLREEMFWGLRDEGAFLNGNRLQVSAVQDLGNSLLVTGFPYDIRQSRDNIVHFNHFLVRAQAIRRTGSAALDLCYVACGRFDGFWEMKLNPWDVCAGALMVKEAGGRATDFSGNEFPGTVRHILASNGLIHGQMQEVLRMG
ncbi:MAG TPA: inositol monophosphatase family protein [Acidobacteriota bacterium]